MPHCNHSTLNILDLDNDALIAILSHLSFDEVAQMRLVCRRFNDLSQVVLNSGFARIKQYHVHCKKKVKDLLPRRESDRRNHLLNPHFEILSSVEIRLNNLSMTYSKYKDYCCFIPGKVLDECGRVLRNVMESKNHLDYFQVLREFRDLSSMAVEHFDEQILPIIKRKQMDLDLMNDNRLRAPITTLCVNQQLFPPGNKDQLAQCNRLLINCQQRSLSLLKTKLKNCEEKCKTHEQEISKLKKKGAEQAKELKEHSKKLMELEQQKLNPKATAISALSKQTTAKSTTTLSSNSKSDSSQKSLEQKQDKLKLDSIPAAIPKQTMSAKLATRSSKPFAPESVPLKAERPTFSTALRMIERKIRPSKVLPFLFGSVTFNVNKSLTIEGIVIPTQLFSSDSSEAVYKENLRFFLKDGNGETLAASPPYEGLTNRGTLLDAYFKRPLFIQSDRSYVIDLHLSSTGSYPLGTASTRVSTSEGVRFSFSNSSTSNAIESIENEVKSGLIRGILFSV